MTVFITRPLDDAVPLRDRWAALGFEPVVTPLLTIQPRAMAAPALDGMRALAFTSANGVRAFAALSPERALPVYAVGEATAAAARQAGFVHVDAAGGDVASLAALITARTPGPVFHGAGASLAGDLAGSLGAQGLSVRRETLYQAVPVAVLPEPLALALKGQRLTGQTRKAEARKGEARKGEARLGVLTLYSPRTARVAVSLITAAGLVSGARHLALAGLSPAVTETAAAAASGALPWRAVRTAATPSAQAMTKVVMDLLAP